MPNEKNTNGLWGLAKWLSLASLIIFADQFTKGLILAKFNYLETQAVFPGFNLTLTFNRGAAFGFSNTQHGIWQPWFFGGVALLVSIILMVVIYRNKSDFWQSFSLTLILSGAIGNLLDRLQYGYVIDFIQVYFKQYFWPSFNIADSAVVIGVLILVIRNFFEAQPKAVFK